MHGRSRGFSVTAITPLNRTEPARRTWPLFWVAQRRRQSGIRRAIGATRRDILRYFQIENFLIVTFGIGLGMVLAYGLNLLLMAHYELPRLPPYYLPIGALVLWGLGQLAVLGPALRAAAVPPVVATRSV